MHLQSSSKFLELLKSAGKKGFNLPGHVAYPESARGIYRLGSLMTCGVGSQMEGLDLIGDFGPGANQSGDSGRPIKNQRLRSKGGFLLRGDDGGLFG